MGYKAKLGRDFARIEPQKFGLVVLATLILFSMMLLSMSIPHLIPLPSLSSRLSLRPMGKTSSQQLETTAADDDSVIAEEKRQRDGLVKETKNFRERDDVIKVYRNNADHLLEFDQQQQQQQLIDGSRKLNKNRSTKTIDNSTKDIDTDLHLNRRNTTATETRVQQELVVVDTLQKKSSSVVDVSLTATTNTSAASSTLTEGKSNDTRNPVPNFRSLCDFSDRRYDICEMTGDIRVHGNSSNVIYVTPENQLRNESWQIRPYARKGDESALSVVRQVHVKSSTEGPMCTANHTVPAVIFSNTGFTGNLFHDFTDVLIPLIITARRYNGEVRFLVTDLSHWWVYKYRLFFKALSHYDLIDFNRDDNVHCFKEVVVGLHCHKELSIDPSRSPEGYTMADFTAFLRQAYSLPRDRPLQVSSSNNNSTRKPRLLLIARKRTRMLLNVNETIAMAEELGYEVVVDEADVSSDVARFAMTVNSCDVIVGVHGAGLTNMVFLPTNGVLIQIVPWGRLESICMLDFGEGARDARLKYLQYSIAADESSLIDMYPRDHEVFKDPLKFHNRGWDLLREMFMDKQNVRLNVGRFRNVLQQALEHLKKVK